MRLVFAGTPDVAVPSLSALLGSRHEVVAVVTRPDAPAGRGRRLTASPVAEAAAAAGVEVLKPTSPREPDFAARLKALAPECCPVVAYGGLIPSNLLDVPSHGWVNLHFSVLPAWRGAAPVQHAIMAGDEVTGATTFRLVEELDAGPVYGIVTEPIRGDDTAGILLRRLSEPGAELLVQTLHGIEDRTLEARPQPAAGVSLAPKLSPDDGHVRWSDPAFAVDRRVRGCTPAPGAWTTHRGDRLKLGPVTLPGDRESALSPGLSTPTGTTSSSEPGRRRSDSATCKRPANLGCARPTGHAACASRSRDWAPEARDVRPASPGACSHRDRPRPSSRLRRPHRGRGRRRVLEPRAGAVARRPGSRWARCGVRDGAGSRDDEAPRNLRRGPRRLCHGWKCEIWSFRS